MKYSVASLELDLNCTYSVLITDRSISVGSTPSPGLELAPSDPPGLDSGSILDPVGLGGDFSPLLEQSA